MGKLRNLSRHLKYPNFANWGIKINNKTSNKINKKNLDFKKEKGNIKESNFKENNIKEINMAENTANQQKLTPESALQVLVSLTEQLKLTKPEHIYVEQCIQMLASAIQKPAEKVEKVEKTEKPAKKEKISVVE